MAEPGTDLAGGAANLLGMRKADRSPGEKGYSPRDARNCRDA
jgi:hypothetical protein